MGAKNKVVERIVEERPLQMLTKCNREILYWSFVSTHTSMRGSDFEALGLPTPFIRSIPIVEGTPWMLTTIW
jgi:hypothetical protein